VFYSIVFLKQDLTIKSIILNVLDFSAAPYSWYIEMYLGLFLLIPFLNIVYNAMPTQKCKIWLILTFVILTSLPSVLNIYNLTSFDWLALPSSSSTNNKIIPNWWQGIYPITYYYIGCYLSEYGLKINKILNILLIFFWTMLSGSFCYWRSYNTTFIWGDWCGYQSLFNVVLTLLVFTLIINTNFDKVPSRLAKFLQKISGLCLGGYLVSWIFDKELYPILSEKVPEVTDRLEYYIIIVPTVVILSLFASYLLSKIQLIIEKIFSFIYGLIQKNQKNTIQT
jgi:surface polysaccharide O-acyltransferase-like enzyme